jgi:hypothetical protein
VKDNEAHRPHPVLRLGIYGSSPPVQFIPVIVLDKERHNCRCRIAWFRPKSELIQSEMTSYSRITPA